IGPGIAALALHLAGRVAALVQVTAGKARHPFAMRQPIPNLAFVAIAVGEGEHAFAIGLVIGPLAAIALAIVPYENALPFLAAILQRPFEAISVGPFDPALSGNHSGGRIGNEVAGHGLVG